MIGEVGGEMKLNEPGRQKLGRYKKPVVCVQGGGGGREKKRWGGAEFDPSPI